ncbi:glycosyltransferase family 39 protein [Candidatus Saccharibacteria bacterium]|nr:glycosyltransferase family 39 protein [Candidatus Saccharibacteria bacterium]
MNKPIKKIHQALQKLLSWRHFKWLIIALFIAGTILRISFLFVGFTAQTNDPQSYFYNAESLINTGELGNSNWWGRNYVAMFPYIFNYIWLLSVFMRIFGTGTLSILALNTFFSLIATGLIYLLFSRTISRRAGLLAAALWFINPVEIVFSALPLPIIPVNTFIIAAVFVTYLLLRKRNQPKKFLSSGALLGLTLGLANIFRPLMAVFLIALALVYVFMLIRRFRLLHLATFAASLAIAWTVMSGIQSLALLPAKRATDYQNLNYFSGWSLLLGSNKEHHGTWNKHDEAIQEEVMTETNGDWPEFDRRLRAIAIERYRSFSASDFPLHWLNKSLVILAGPYYSIQFELRNYRNFGHIGYGIFTHVYLATLLLLLIFGLTRFILTRHLQLTVLTALLTAAGILAAHILLTEVMDRYSIPLIPLLFIAGFWGAFFTLPTQAHTTPRTKKSQLKK